MAWDKTLQDAAFRGVKFDVLRVRDVRARAVAEFEVPFVDGGVVDDLGWRIRRIALTAVFFGADYETRLAAFLKALGEPGAGELMHPVFGLMKVQVASVETPHDAEAPDYCEVPVEFIETGDPAPFFAAEAGSRRAEAARQAVSAGRETSLATMTAGLRELTRDLRGIRARAAVADRFAEALGKLRAGAGGVVTAALDVIDYPAAWVGDVRATLTALAALPDRVDGRLDGNLASWRTMLGRVPPSGTRRASGGSRAVGSEAALQAGAQDLADDTVTRERALALADVAAAVLADEAEAPTLTPADVERVANDARAALQRAVDSARAVHPVERHHAVAETLKDVAWQIQRAALAVLVQRPPLVRRSAPADANLHQLAHWWYGDHTRAAELLRLNPALRYPNFIRQGDTLYAYAR